MNEIDDNGDGLADCDDPQCWVTHVCAESIPGSWTGVGWIDPESTTLPCSAGLLQQNLFAGLNAPALSCGCECGTPYVHCALDLTCSPGKTDCVTNPTTTPITSCAAMTTLPQGVSGCTAGSPRVLGGCPATTKTTRPAVSWATSGRACMAAEGGACSAGGTCVPRAPAGAVGPCIARAGDYPCPTTGIYTTKRLFYTGAPVDSRTCSACATCAANGLCSCDSANGCGVSIYTEALCTGTPQTVGGPGSGGTCTSITVQNSAEVSAAAFGVIGPTGTSCVPGTSTATGSISPGPKVTVCCSPVNL
jgi:hypothetical protein